MFLTKPFEILPSSLKGKTSQKAALAACSMLHGDISARGYTRHIG